MEKRPPLLLPDMLTEQNSKAIRNDTNFSGKRKLLQLERLQRLHILYEKGKLCKCLLSYYLLVTKPDCLKLLQWVGSKMAESLAKLSLEDLPKVPRRLAKIPSDYLVGSDKGFTGIECHLPNLNTVVTPAMVTNSNNERLSTLQILSDVLITTIRAPCEIVFKIVYSEDVLSEKIPYGLISLLPFGHALAHGEANLHQPLCRPGKCAIVGDDYWSNCVNYEIYQRPTESTRNVEYQFCCVCSKCGEGGIVQICSICNRFFHFDHDCHNFDRCLPVARLNPYK